MSKLPIVDFVNREPNAVFEQQPARSAARRPRVLWLPTTAFSILVLTHPAISRSTEAFFSDRSRLSGVEEFILLCPKAALVLGGLWLAAEVVLRRFQRKT